MTTTEQNNGNTLWLHCTHWSKIKGLSFCGHNWRLKQLIQCTNSSPLSDCTSSICRSNSSTYRNLFTFKAPFTMGNKEWQHMPNPVTIICQNQWKLMLGYEYLYACATSYGSITSCWKLHGICHAWLKVQELQLFWPLEFSTKYVTYFDTWPLHKGVIK